MPKKISVVLPAYNSMAYLPTAVESILSQDYRDLELIVVNDGSSDGTAEYLASLSDSRVVVVNNSRNVGVTQSLNNGVAAATGELIARMDADDIATPNRLRLQLEFLEINGYDLVSACATTLGKFPARTFGIPMNDREVAFSLLFFNSIVHPLVMGRAWVFKNHPYSPEFEWAEDYHLWTRLALSGIKIGIDHSRLLRYRLHSSQVSFAKQEKQRDLTRRVGENYMRELIAGHGSAQPKDGDLLARFEFGLCILPGASAVGPETRARVLRAILPSSLASWGELGALRATYQRHGASMALADYVIALASLLSKKSGSDVPKRMAARLVS